LSQNDKENTDCQILESVIYELKNNDKIIKT